MQHLQIAISSTLLALSLFAISCAEDPTCQEEGKCPSGTKCAANDECKNDLCIIQDVDGEDTFACADPCSIQSECGEQTCGVVEDVDSVLVTGCSERELGFKDLGDVCGSDDECVGAICSSGRCASLCTTDAECSPDARCDEVALRPDLNRGICQWAPLRPDLVLDGLDIGVDGSEAIAIGVPSDVVSLTVTIRNDDGVDFGRRIGFRTVVDPNGLTLFDVDGDEQINPSAIPYPQATVLMLPLTDDPRGKPLAGTYTVTLGVWDVDPTAENPFTPTNGRVEAVDVTFAYAGQEGGVLDLVVHNSPNSGLAQEDMPAFIDTLTDQLESTFAAANLAVGRVQTATLGEESDTLDSSNDVRTLVSGSAVGGRDATALNVFVIGNLNFSNAAGFTGTVPSPAGLYGYGSSGVVVEYEGNDADTALLTAHEIGHFLGLQHTTDFDQNANVVSHDPLSDTPECTSGSINDCPDRPNLMFPIIDYGGEATVSGAQASVIRTSPALYELRRPDLCEGADVLDITQNQAAAGLLTTANLTGSCGGAGPEKVHVFRVFQPTEVTFQIAGYTGAFYIRGDSCDGAELVCAAVDGELEQTQMLMPGTYFVVTDAEEPGASYRLRAR